MFCVAIVEDLIEKNYENIKYLSLGPIHFTLSSKILKFRNSQYKR